MHADLLPWFCLQKFDAMVAVVTGMDDQTVNAIPAPGANSAFQLVTHCLGMARRWSSTVNLGVEVPRDRDAEFTARGTVAELTARAAEVRAALVEDMDGTDPDGAPARPPAGDGGGRPWLATTNGVWLHIFEELCQHLGHLEVTRDVVVQPSAHR